MRVIAPSLRVVSAGVEAAPAVSALATEVLEHGGWNATDLHPTQLDSDLRRRSDVVVVLCDYAATRLDQVAPLANDSVLVQDRMLIIHPFDDPYLVSGSPEQRRDAYELCRSQIEMWLRSELLPRLL